MQVSLGLAIAIELGLLLCCRRGDGRPPAILDTLHDRLLRETGSVFAVLTVASLFTSEGLGEMFSWHMQARQGPRPLLVGLSVTGPVFDRSGRRFV